jgi:hypothetical protein
MTAPSTDTEFTLVGDTGSLFGLTPFEDDVIEVHCAESNPALAPAPRPHRISAHQETDPDV